jgi:hypothetical protein
MGGTSHASFNVGEDGATQILEDGLLKYLPGMTDNMITHSAWHITVNLPAFWTSSCC